MTPIDVIMEAGCIATGTTAVRIRGPERDRMMARKRRFIAEKMRLEGYSYPAIGAAMGGRNHTTIMAILGATPALRRKRRRW